MTLGAAFRKGKYWYLLVSLLLVFFLAPLVRSAFALSHVGDVALAAVLLTGVYAISDSHRGFAVVLILVVLSFVSNGLVAVFGVRLADKTLLSQLLVHFAVLSGLLFFALTAVWLVLRVWRDDQVTTDTIIGSVCAYLLLGLAWAWLYVWIDVLIPGSFKGFDAAGPLAVFSLTEYAPLIYFSFVTIATLGYGDISPVTSAAQMLASLEAVVGQFYIAVLVARLVALHLTQTTGSGPEQGD